MKNLILLRGLPGVGKSTLVNSINILQKLGSDFFNIIDDYYPNPSGTLSIMWDFPNSILELEIGNQEFSYYFKVYDANETKYFYAKEFNESNIDELKSNLHKVIKNK
jgi:energy-coupling factor transporter ATP-binding protein EcfA2